MCRLSRVSILLDMNTLDFLKRSFSSYLGKKLLAHKLWKLLWEESCRFHYGIMYVHIFHLKNSVIDLWELRTILGCLKFGDDIVVSYDSDSIPAELESYSATAEFITFSSMDTGNKKGFISAAAYHENTLHNNVATSSFNLRGCTSHDVPVKKSIDVGIEVKDANILAMPPRIFGENFEETYDVILILDDRENFGSV
ncbi:uncharacterized protein LOC109828512 isoform X1 [Asparagus officinalis]|uniref:uncharacterized protein LOC109828512 isoform X1 n=1 Tax=Asparagus officinalis TaxID=4686 RepID=UPI00098E06FB|nr:uncharacterized protein LOC109828512 isoform X1 [Asparagus officinalis]